MALDLISPAAIGASQAQLESTFGITTALDWVETTNDVTGRYDGSCIEPDFFNASLCGIETPLVSIGNRIFVNNQVQLNETYEATVSEVAEPLDFSDSEASLEAINGWVQNSTNDLVDKIVDDVNPAWIILAVNAIYLKASWRIPFGESHTNEDAFGDSTALFMHAVDYFPYANFDGRHAFQLLTFGQGLSLVVVTGTEAVSVEEIEFESKFLALGMPKFKFSATYENSLKKGLQDMGMTAPFETGLCVRSGSCGAYIDVIVQKTVIDVNELGMEAAAVTAIGVVESAPIDQPQEVLVKDPFRFAIYDSVQGLVLMEGRVIKPEYEGAEATLDAKHEDENFWMDTFFVDAMRMVEEADPPVVTEEPKDPDEPTPEEPVEDPDVPDPEDQPAPDPKGATEEPQNTDPGADREPVVDETDPSTPDASQTSSAGYLGASVIECFLL